MGEVVGWWDRDFMGKVCNFHRFCCDPTTALKTEVFFFFKLKKSQVRGNSVKRGGDYFELIFQWTLSI